MNILKQKTGKVYSYIIFYPNDLAVKVLIYRVSSSLLWIGSTILQCGAQN